MYKIKVSNKELTAICTYCIAMTSVLFWIWQFTSFVMGYTLTYKEPNIVIASCELLMALISFGLLAELFRRNEWDKASELQLQATSASQNAVVD